MVNFLAAVVDYEETGVRSMLITTVVALVGAVIHLYKAKDKALKDKDDKILEVIKNHQEDLKESNNDMKVLIEKYSQFTNHLKELVHGK